MVLLSFSLRRYDSASAAAIKMMKMDDSTLAAHEGAVRQALSAFWNCGANQFAHQQHALAKNLCTTAMKLLDKLPAASKDTLKPRMVS